MNLSFSKSLSSFIAFAAIGGVVLVGCASSDGSSDPQEDAPATTSEDLSAGCRWVREPGPCPVAKPGGGALGLCYPTLVGYAHWERVCGAAPKCPVGEVWNGVGCTPNM